MHIGALMSPCAPICNPFGLNFKLLVRFWINLDTNCDHLNELVTICDAIWANCMYYLIRRPFQASSV